MHSEKAVIHKPGRQLSPETELLEPSSWTSHLQNCEKINFCCLNHSVYGILLWQPELNKVTTFSINLRIQSVCFGSIFILFLPTSFQHGLNQHVGKIYILVIYFCVTNHPKTHGQKTHHHFIMITDSVGQELRKGTEKTACLCSMMSGASGGKA